MAGFMLPASAAPHAVCASPIYDFGVLKDNDVAVHQFVVENRGDETLTFSWVRACCGATASLRDTSVAPGTNTVIEVRYLLKGYHGKVKKSVYAATNDPKQPHLRLHLNGRVERSAGSSPPLAGGVPKDRRSADMNTGGSDIVAVPPVIIDYFFEPGCPECLRVSREILPELREHYAGFYRIERHDTGVVSNVVMLIAYQQALGITNNASVSMVVDYGHALCGIDEISSGLTPLLDRLIEERMFPGWQPPQPVLWEANKGIETARERAKAFTVPAVLAAGLIDGINPCAISTLVFFMSMLVAAGVRGGGLLLMGAAYTFASFVTYTAIGFGLLRSLHMLEAYPAARIAFETALAMILLILAALSFRDAFRYRRSHNPVDVTVQLPAKIKKLIHALIRNGVRSRHILIGGFAAGVFVTALETVCTGQVYVPTLALVLRDAGGAVGAFRARMWGLLLLYNAMFILPLMVAIILTRYGLTTQAMLKLSRKNVPFSKILLGLFFLALATYLILS